nr:MAG TPA: nucleoside triphosphate pyrophosphohydrolase [Caudoviricetes sp.]
MLHYAQANLILDHYGIEHQKAKTIEELAELIVALQKNLLSDTDGLSREVLEEIADVEIMILQLLSYKGEFSIVYEIIDQKLGRQLDRIKEE